MENNTNQFLEIVDLKKGFGSGETRQEVLRGMNFSVAKGEFCVLLGPSGSGKSTLLNIIGGIDHADSGYISIAGDKLEDMSEKKLTQYRRKHLGYVFQMYNLIPNLNVKENIEVGAYLSDNALDIDELLHPQGEGGHVQRQLSQHVVDGDTDQLRRQHVQKSNAHRTQHSGQIKPLAAPEEVPQQPGFLPSGLCLCLRHGKYSPLVLSNQEATIWVIFEMRSRFGGSSRDGRRAALGCLARLSYKKKSELARGKLRFSK